MAKASTKPAAAPHLDDNSDGKRENQFFMVIKRLCQRPTAVIGMVIFGFILFCAIFGDWLAPYDYAAIRIAEAYQKPSAAHWFGTDNLGQDILSRMLVGAKWSLIIGFGSQVISIVGGIFVGSIAGFFGQRVDNIIMRICDVVQAVPGTVLNIALAAAFSNGVMSCIIALGVGHIAGKARLIRAQILKIRKNEFIDAATSINCSTPRIILKHVLPNTISPIIVSTTMGMAASIMSASSLSYLGLGVQAPTPEWGAMLSASRDYILGYSYMCLFPGLAIGLVVLSLNLIGDGLRDALDPKLKQ